MRNLKSTTIIIFLFAGLFYISERSLPDDNTITSSPITLIGSTPGDSLIKSMLQIKQDLEVDFIRWTLSFNTNKKDTNTFILNIEYGLSKPNTTGFAAGYKNETITGIYVISKNKQTLPAEIYHLFFKGSGTPSLSLIKLNSNIFHVLTPDNKLMPGNGGWSYTLNRKKPSEDLSPLIGSMTENPFRDEDKGEYVVFAGRTPSNEISEDYGFIVNEVSFKLKWKLTFYRDINTLLPAKYNLKRTDRRANDIEGIWDVIYTSLNNLRVTIYRLDPDKPDKTISLLAGDDNVLFFLDKKQNLYVGNKDFSYTLDRLSR